MLRRISFAIVIVGCAGDPETSTTAQDLQGNDHDGLVVAMDVQLARGGDLGLAAWQEGPAPVYVVVGHVPGREVRVRASGASRALTLAGGFASVIAVLTNTVSQDFAQSQGPNESLELQFGPQPVPYSLSLGPSDAPQVDAIATGAVAIAGGAEASAAMTAFAAPLALAGPCSTAQCDQLAITYDVESTGIGDRRVEIVVRDPNAPHTNTGVPTAPGVADASVSVCFTGAPNQPPPPPEVLVTDAHGVAVTNAPAGTVVAGVIVSAVVGGVQVVCQRGSTCENGGGDNPQLP